MKTIHITAIIILVLLAGILVYAFNRNDDAMMKADTQQKTDMMKSDDVMNGQENNAMETDTTMMKDGTTMMETDATMEGGIQVQ